MSVISSFTIIVHWPAMMYDINTVLALSIWFVADVKVCM
uniref:Uncharacterized protein n=1 Tax=Arundo donax TaxID=35708 RepID=A0A0A9HS15_ARUDO